MCKAARLSGGEKKAQQSCRRIEVSSLSLDGSPNGGDNGAWLIAGEWVGHPGGGGMGCEVYREASLWNALLILFIQDFHSPLDKLLLCPPPFLPLISPDGLTCSCLYSLFISNLPFRPPCLGSQACFLGGLCSVQSSVENFLPQTLYSLPP